AEIERPDLVLLALARRQHDDRKREAPSTQLGEQVEAVTGSQVIEIDHRDGGIVPLEDLERGSGIRCDERDQARLAHEERDDLEEVPVVVDDEDLVAPRAAGAARLGAHPRSSERTGALETRPLWTRANSATRRATQAGGL